MYIVQATVNGRQIPTFYLNENVQGITSESHAISIALDILNPMRSFDLDIFVSVIYV